LKRGSKESYKLLVDIAKFGFTMWGTAGAVNTLGKVIERGEIYRKDIFHVLFLSPKKPEISDTSLKIIEELARTIKAKQATEDTSKMSHLRQVDFIPQPLRDIIGEIKNIPYQTTKTAYDDPRALQWRNFFPSFPVSSY